MTDSQKGRDFLRNGFRDPVYGFLGTGILPGVNAVNEKELRLAGIKYAYQLYGHFLICRCDSKAFTQWLCDIIPSSTSKNRADIWDILNTYLRNNM